MTDTITIEPKPVTSDSEAEEVDCGGMSLEEYLVHLFTTSGLDFGDGDCCSIIEAVEEEAYHARFRAIEDSVDTIMPGVVVALVKARRPDLVKGFTDERLLTMSKELSAIYGYPPPRAKVEALEAALEVLHPFFAVEGYLTPSVYVQAMTIAVGKLTYN